MADKSIAAALKAYFLRCPLLGDHPLGVNWLPDHGVAFSIDTTPASQILRRYMSGSSLRQYLFVLRSVDVYKRQAREFSEYEYERDPRTGEVLPGYPDLNNHHIDAVRYATEAIWKRRGA